jgi:glycosyltransferase involved in cell wall biosynthesis
VVPAFNAERTLNRAIDSVFSQTAVPAELIMVDDGSVDGTWEIIQEICSTHSGRNINCIRQNRNYGVAIARNVAWDTASNQYVAFLDSDDTWHKQKLELQYEWMRDHPNVVICGHRCEVVSENAQPTLNRLNIDRSVKMLGMSDFLLSNRFSTPTVMVLRDLPYRFSQEMRYCEDYHLWLQVVAEYRQVAWIDISMAYLYKEKYGASGLSGDLLKMEKGELLAISKLYAGKRIGFFVWSISSIWSIVKFLYRVIRTKFWRQESV